METFYLYKYRCYGEKIYLSNNLVDYLKIFLFLFIKSWFVYFISLVQVQIMAWWRHFSTLRLQQKCLLVYKIHIGHVTTGNTSWISFVCKVVRPWLYSWCKFKLYPIYGSWDSRWYTEEQAVWMVNLYGFQPLYSLCSHSSERCSMHGEQESSIIWLITMLGMMDFWVSCGIAFRMRLIVRPCLTTYVRAWSVSMYSCCRL